MRIPKALALLWKIAGASGDHYRYQLDCIRAERDQDGNAWLVATDGRLLVAIELDEPPPRNGVAPQPGVSGFVASIPVPLWRAAFALCEGTRTSWVEHITLDEHHATVTLRAASAHVIQAEERPGKFPEWRAVMQAYVEGKAGPLRVDYGYLERLLKLVGIFGMECAQIKPAVDDKPSMIVMTDQFGYTKSKAYCFLAPIQSPKAEQS